MRMMRCNRCGKVFREDDADAKSECVGEFWGAPAYIEYNICPACGSDEIEENNEDDEDDEL